MKPHKHAELIKDWADGAETQALVKPEGGWVAVKNPRWDENNTNRIKPQPKHVVLYYCDLDHLNGQHEIRCCFSIEHDESIDQLKIVLVGETRIPKSPKVL